MEGGSYDAVVAGAGPAGAATAREIAQQGFRVLLLEEHQRVGRPSHCSGLVSPRTLALAGIGDDLIINRITGAVIHSPAGAELAIGGDRLHALAIDREGFDRALVQRAQDAGAELALGTKVISSDCLNGQLLVRVRYRRRDLFIQTRLLIGADGAQSRVARGLDTHTLDSDRVVGLGAEVKLSTAYPQCAHVFVGRGVAPGFFAWVIPLGRERARLGIATNGGRPPVHYLRALLDRYPQIFAGVENVRQYGGLIPLKRLSRITGDGVMLVGDAAGHVKPTSGGGIYTALLGAGLCAKVAAKVLTHGDVSAGRLACYETAWARVMGKELERGWDLRRAVLAFSDDEIGRLLRLLRSPRLQPVISRYGDIDFPSHLASRLVLQGPLLRLMRVALKGLC
ncbi:MAG: geranylgeranyl reductase family protein [Dehalococcoidia bacterium]